MSTSKENRLHENAQMCQFNHRKHLIQVEQHHGNAISQIKIRLLLNWKFTDHHLLKEQVRFEREFKFGSSFEIQLLITDGVIQSQCRTEYTVGQFTCRHFHVAQSLEHRGGQSTHGCIDIHF